MRLINDLQVIKIHWNNDKLHMFFHRWFIKIFWFHRQITSPDMLHRLNNVLYHLCSIRRWHLSGFYEIGDKNDSETSASVQPGKMSANPAWEFDHTDLIRLNETRDAELFRILSCRTWYLNEAFSDTTLKNWRSYRRATMLLRVQWLKLCHQRYFCTT